MLKSKCILRTLLSSTARKWLDEAGKINYSTYHSKQQKMEDYSEKESATIKIDKLYNRKITKLDFNDSSLSKIILQVKSKKMRTKSNLIFFEGKRILKEALEVGIVPLMVFFSRHHDIEDFSFPESTKLYKMSYKEMKLWSDLTTSPGVMVVCRKPDLVQNCNPDVPVTIVCDNIRDPGNLGALFRNSVGAGVKDILLTKGCVDIWDPKVIRGGAGTQFRIPIHNDLDWSDIENLIKKDTLLLIATNEIEDNEIDRTNNSIIPYCELNYSNYSNIAIIIGGETEGVSENAYNLMKFYDSKKVIIPLSNAVESLNCVSALSIILFEIKRQIVFIK